MNTLRFIVAGSLVAICASSFAQGTPSRDDRMAQALQDYRAKPATTAPMRPMSGMHSMHHKSGMNHKMGMKHHARMHGASSMKAPVGKKSATDMTKG
ncbi:MAG: hypothetical protein JWQ11_55 [Rhizobacter sp.]|nr:hypothetical protein [Rhizobacter sp.]